MEVDAKKRKTEEVSEVPAKKAKEAPVEEEESDGGDKEKRTLFVRNLPFSVTKEQVNSSIKLFGSCLSFDFVKIFLCIL
jgi:RNA recognition motif-containing protein